MYATMSTIVIPGVRIGGMPVVAGSEIIPTMISTIIACSKGPKCRAPGASGGGGALFFAFSSLTVSRATINQPYISHHASHESLPSFKKERNCVPVIGMMDAQLLDECNDEAAPSMLRRTMCRTANGSLRANSDEGFELDRVSSHTLLC